MSWRPLSRREDPTYDEPREGVPDYLADPLLDWISAVVRSIGFGALPLMAQIQLRLRISPPLDLKHINYALASLKTRVNQDGTLFLDTLDLLLHLAVSQSRRTGLSNILRTGGSVWDVREPDQRAASEGAKLVRRAPGPVADTMAIAASSSDRAHSHLNAAWGALMGRSPDPSVAYREAIRAVEAAAKPIVLPNNERATLGQMIAALRDKPDKWTFAIANSSPSDVADLAKMIWTGQVDRHGTDDMTVPESVTFEEADAAVYIAIALVRIFTADLVVRAPENSASEEG